MQEIDQQQSELPLKALIAAAFITYLSCEPEDVRRSVLEEWCSDFGLQKFALNEILSSERKQLIWKNEGLPSDALSVENAICILHVCIYFFFFNSE